MALVVRAICPICGYLAYENRLEREHNFPDVRVFDMRGFKDIEILPADDETMIRIVEMIRKKCIKTLKQIEELYNEIGYVPEDDDEIE